jgi:hypothetical protein
MNRQWAKDSPHITQHVMSQTPIIVQLYLKIEFLLLTPLVGVDFRIPLLGFATPSRPHRPGHIDRQLAQQPAAEPYPHVTGQAWLPFNHARNIVDLLGVNAADELVIDQETLGLPFLSMKR